MKYIAKNIHTVCIVLSLGIYVTHIHNTLSPRQNGRHLSGDIFKCSFLNENNWNSIKISLKFVLKGPIDNIPALIQKMAWRRSGAKPWSEQMVVSLLMHIYASLGLNVLKITLPALGL